MGVAAEDLAAFEAGAHANGVTWWSARWLMEQLDYSTWGSFEPVLSRALTSCMGLGIEISESFAPSLREHDGRSEEDFRLSRFACFLVAHHADGTKPAVARARSTLASLAPAAAGLDPALLERLAEREALRVGERVLSSVARRVGVRSFELGIFRDAGYRGMYGTSLRRLKEHKQLDPALLEHTLYDYMSTAELAANALRVTRTAERLQRYPVEGLLQAEGIARDVGDEVRSMLTFDEGPPPEDLPLEEDIHHGRNVLAAIGRQLAKLDQPEA